MVLGSGIAGVMIGVLAFAMFFVRILHHKWQQRMQQRNRAESIGLPSVHNNESNQEQDYVRTSRVDSVVIQNERKFKNLIQKGHVEKCLKIIFFTNT